MLVTRKTVYVWIDSEFGEITLCDRDFVKSYIWSFYKITAPPWFSQTCRQIQSKQSH